MHFLWNYYFVLRLLVCSSGLYWILYKVMLCRYSSSRSASRFLWRTSYKKWENQSKREALRETEINLLHLNIFGPQHLYTSSLLVLVKGWDTVLIFLRWAGYWHAINRYAFEVRFEQLQQRIYTNIEQLHRPTSSLTKSISKIRNSLTDLSIYISKS